jgi:glyoxylase-like metal-dependent hydrolase (beta-lactamase superfamily II)
VVGHGSLALLAGSSSSLRGGHSFFEHDLLPKDRTIELPDPATSSAHQRQTAVGDVDFTRQWRAVGSLPQILDVFGDGSLLIANAPGHLPGHINLLTRVSRDHQIYLAGDACHDRRLLTGEKSIGEWDDAAGHTCCIHADRKEAEATIERIRLLEKQGVEIIFAHDVEWESDPSNQGRYFGAVQ